MNAVIIHLVILLSITVFLKPDVTFGQTDKSTVNSEMILSETRDEQKQGEKNSLGSGKNDEKSQISNDRSFQSIRKKFLRDSLRVEKIYRKKLKKIDRDKTRNIMVLEKRKKGKLTSEINRDNVRLKIIVRDLLKLRKQLKISIQDLEEVLETLPPDSSVHREKIAGEIRTYNDHYKEMNKVGVTIIKGIKGDSTLSNTVVEARMKALELLMKYESLLLERQYYEDMAKVDKDFREKLKAFEAQNSQKLKQIHEEEKQKMEDMRKPYMSEIIPLEKKAKVLQDSLDLLAIRSISADDKLDSLIVYKKELDAESNHLTKTLNELKEGISGKTFNLVLQLLLESERAVYQDSLEKAEEKCLLAIKLAPTYAISYTKLGSIYYAGGQLDSAQSAWEKALKLDPTNEELKKFMFLHGLY